MKSFGIAFALLAASFTGFTQPSFSYDNFFYYRNNLYLGTPSVLLSAAGYKAAAGDTAGAIALVNQAVRKNLFDTGYITENPRIKFITKTAGWNSLKGIVERNRRACSDPGKMQILTSDIDNFWKLFDLASKPGVDRQWMNDYIMKGSQGLRTFFELRMGLRITNILESIRKRRKYFESIRPVSLQLYSFRPRIIEAARKLKELYPPSIFPPTSFTIGTFSAFGTSDGGSGQLIGAEFVCDSNTVDKSELNAWEKSVITDSSRLLGIIIHELIHIEQESAPTGTLLGKSINEGAADFITQLVLGYNLNIRIHEYGNAHEKELLAKFKKQMDGEDISDWLYNGFNAKEGVPADLGYFMGYKICEAYYNKAGDKKQAIKEILTVQDYKKFLEQSGYGSTNP